MTDKVALYTRVSTDYQTAENQEQALRSWADGRGWQVLSVFADTGSAFQNADQRELRKLLDGCRLGKYNLVLVTELSRLTRGGVADLLRVVKQFEDYGARVLSIQETWLEYPQEFRDILLSFIGWAANYESRMFGERVKRGMDRSRAAGKKMGRPKGSKDKKKRRRGKNERKH